MCWNGSTRIVPPGPPPGEGPPHARSGPIAPALRKTRVLEVARAVEGAGSIDVDVGQVLLVRVQYAALGVEGNYAATLSIAADKWDPVAVPLSMFLAEVTTAASDVLNIAQGSTADLAVELRSVMGPAVDVTYARHCQVVRLVGEGGHVRALPALGHRIKPSRIYAEIVLELAHGRHLRPRSEPPSHQSSIVARPHEVSPWSKMIRDLRMHRQEPLGVSHRLESSHSLVLARA